MQANAQADASYSPVLWGAVFIPVVSGAELFVDPQTRESFGYFVLGFFYIASVRYTLAVALGVYAHDELLHRHKTSRKGLGLWFCYFFILVLCSLLVPGAAIFGLSATIAIALSILLIAILQGFLCLGALSGTSEANAKWRFWSDILIIILLLAEIFRTDGEISFQAPCIALAFLLLLDFNVNPEVKSNLSSMVSALATYIRKSWKKASV